jgi:hypothetical protein
LIISINFIIVLYSHICPILLSHVVCLSVCLFCAALCCRFQAYRQGEGVDGIAGAEALISHVITKKLGVPCAHAPAFLSMETGTVKMQCSNDDRDNHNDSKLTAVALLLLSYCSIHGGR